MAWISVDQNLFTGKFRSLCKSIECTRYEAMGILVSLWLWGMNNADSDGVIENADEKDVEMVISGNSESSVDSELILRKLIETNWILKDDRGLVFSDWKEIYGRASNFDKVRQSHVERTRRYRERIRDKGQDKECDVTCDVTVDVTKKEKPHKGENAEKYSDDFTAFWSAYPRKTDKGMAYRKYKARRNDGYSADDLLAAAKRYAEECIRNRTEQKYIKHGKTFLGDSLPFADYLQKDGDTPTQYPWNPYADTYPKTDPDVNPFRNFGRS